QLGDAPELAAGQGFETRTDIGAQVPRAHRQPEALPDRAGDPRAGHLVGCHDDHGRRLPAAGACPGYSDLMPHPIMFDEDDPVLARVRALALALPGAAEKISHGRPNFFTTKVFATYSGSLRSDGTRFPQSILVKPDEGEYPALLQHPRYYEPKYMAPYGWVGIGLAEGPAGGASGRVDG